MNQPEHEARIAVLDAALEETIGGATPPDLWARIDAQRDARATRPRWTWLRAAAIMFAGIGVLLLVRSSQNDNELDAVSLANADLDLRDPAGPRSVDEARAWLGATIHGVQFEHTTVFDVRRGVSVPLALHPFEGLFRTSAAWNLSDPADFEAMQAGFANLQPAPQPTAAWECKVEIRAGERTVRMMLRGCSAFPSVDAASARITLGIRGPDGVMPARADGAIDRELVELLAQHTHELLRARGIAIGIDGLRQLDDATPHLRCHGVGIEALTEMHRFKQLTSLDIRFSDALHDSCFVPFLAPLARLDTLIARGSLLERRDLEAIAALGNLTDLFLLEPGFRWDPLEVSASARHVDDEVIERFVAGMPKLRDLALPGARITDAGLARLAALPELKSLVLAGCDTADGAGFEAFERHSALRSLWLRDCPNLTDTALHWIAQIPSLNELSIGLNQSRSPPEAIRALSRLVSSSTLDELVIDARHRIAAATSGAWFELLRALAASTQLRKLTILDAADLCDDDLRGLFGAKRLARISFTNCGRVTDAGVTALRAALTGAAIERR